MQETTHYVTYYVAQQHRPGIRPLFSGQGNRENHASTHAAHANANNANNNHATGQPQQQAIQEFFTGKQPNAEHLASFVETPDSRRTAKWPELQKALEACQQRNATLLIAELGTLTSNEIFSKLLLDSAVKFHCLDQPFVNQTILEALSKHAQVQRKLHGKLIREGLKMTSAKSGNPNAAEVISKVNKPKIDTAIVFALLLQPIIQDYRRKGYSQRQMVKTLNDEGFTAPEGGKWVLSQLQKVLDRVRLNEVAAEAKALLPELKSQASSNQGSTQGSGLAHGLTQNATQGLAQIAEALNAKGIQALKKGPWDEAQAKKLQERINQIEEIELINRFVLHLLPVLHDYRRKGLKPSEMLQEFHQAGLRIRPTSNAGTSVGAVALSA